MITLLIVIIVLIVAQMVRYEVRSYTYKRDYQRGIEQNNKNNEKLLQYQQEVCKFFERTKELVEIIETTAQDTADILTIFQAKLDTIESKLDAIEAKTPYKKKVRKVKVAGVEVPIEALETKSANANGTDVIIDNSKTNKEAHEENN